MTGPRGTNRCWAACLLTPMLVPIWLQDAPERRAWSTKWPISESAWSLSPADTETASERLSSGEPAGRCALTNVMSVSSDTGEDVMRQC